MTAAEIPLMTGQPGQDSESTCFMGVTAYDDSVSRDLPRSDMKAGIGPFSRGKPAAGTADRTVWTLALRRDVKLLHTANLFDHARHQRLLHRPTLVGA